MSMSMDSTPNGFKTHCKARRTRTVIFILAVLVFLWHFGHFLVKFGHSTEKKFESKFELPMKFAQNLNTPQHIGGRIVKNPTSLLLQRKRKEAVIFFVKSSPENSARRQMIRNTWGSIKQVAGKQIFLVFLIGKPLDKVHNDDLRKEKLCFDDILQTADSDTHPNLVIKTLSAIRWIVQNLYHPRSFYIFTNDNCVVHIGSTVKFLKTLTGASKDLMYCGFKYEKNSGVIRGGKWGVHWSQYPATTYPDFCRGVMVILSPTVVAQIYKVAMMTALQGFPLEDVMVYGILRHKINNSSSNIQPVINGGHPLVFYPWDATNAVVGKMERKWNEWRLELRDFKLREESQALNNKQCSSL
uniref:beta-1,3-galactosyltransferase bre-5-like isoform X2 n=1 Tax=Ciona intestinalis TaxID=7719 RepID=UPI00089DC092|nr:beta-1,3-galactosyltransferase bre-5-like isoform X2 [Ciona intestinalis]|eukprot:XP_018671248.1 beta-1,3-galactosyltransferase bre-5-like isoform X2 [Ciona intestinalis]